MSQTLDKIDNDFVLVIAGINVRRDEESRRRRFLRSFVDGLMSTFTFSAPPPRELDLPITRAILNRSDADAIQSDWEAIGNDLRIVIETYENEQEPPQEEEHEEAGSWVGSYTA